MNYKHLFYTLSEAGIATVTLNRPEARNAINAEEAQAIGLVKTEDHQEGVRAFREKRKPDFKGK